ncbi:MAG: hypothetical protein QM820_18870 [Minicystis sp.]
MDDDEMERAVRHATGAVRKPWWFTLIGLGLVVGETVAVRGISEAAGWRPEASPLSGLVGGVLLTVAVLGHSPGRYPDARTGEYETFWSRRSTRARVQCALVAAVLLVIGLAVDRHLAGR